MGAALWLHLPALLYTGTGGSGAALASQTDPFPRWLGYSRGPPLMTPNPALAHASPLDSSPPYWGEGGTSLEITTSLSCRLSALPTASPAGLPRLSSPLYL